jgi:hypothetical protein
MKYVRSIDVGARRRMDSLAVALQFDRAGDVKMGDYKWHRMDATAVSALLASTTTPGVLYPLPVECAPAQMRERMQGLQSWYVSNFVSAQSLTNGVTVGGEFNLVRTQGDARAYVYAFGTSSDKHVYFAGPFTNFPNHHFASSASVPLDSLFGHTPYSKPE